MSAAELILWIMCVCMCAWVSGKLLSDKDMWWAGVLCTVYTLMLCMLPLLSMTADGS